MLNAESFSEVSNYYRAQGMSPEEICEQLDNFSQRRPIRLPEKVAFYGTAIAVNNICRQSEPNNFLPSTSEVTDDIVAAWKKLFKQNPPADMSIRLGRRQPSDATLVLPFTSIDADTCIYGVVPPGKAISEELTAEKIPITYVRSVVSAGIALKFKEDFWTLYMLGRYIRMHACAVRTEVFGSLKPKAEKLIASIPQFSKDQAYRSLSTSILRTV